MFGLSGSEILVIFVILILFVRPEDLPTIVHHLGKIYGQVMRMYYTFLDEIKSLEK